MVGRIEQARDGVMLPLRGLRLLLVQEPPEPELTRALARQGHDVLAVGVDERPVRLLRVFSPDVIVLATGDGADVCRDLRRAAPIVAIVAIVRGGDVEDRIELLDAGADDCLGTPFRLDELKARILAVWRRAAAAAADGQLTHRMAGAQ